MNRPGLWYAVRREDRAYIYMHRLIMDVNTEHGIPPNHFIDHLDGDGLNNQLENLEVVTSAENTRRYHRKRMSSSGGHTVAWY
ncbi:MAG: HNH endonuclease [Chthoniobacterales bacterium]